jgi:hypothetical protein
VHGRIFHPRQQNRLIPTHPTMKMNNPARIPVINIQSLVTKYPLFIQSLRDYPFFLLAFFFALPALFFSVCDLCRAFALS